VGNAVEVAGEHDGIMVEFRDADVAPDYERRRLSIGRCWVVHNAEGNQQGVGGRRSMAARWWVEEEQHITAVLRMVMVGSEDNWSLPTTGRHSRRLGAGTGFKVVSGAEAEGSPV
jgi:hypothetical protein